MKPLKYLILAILFFSSCATLKKVEKLQKIEKTTEKEVEKERDSVHSVSETLPTVNEIRLNVKDLKFLKDFNQKISSGPGNETSISKIGNDLVLKSKNKGSKTVTSKVKDKEKEVVYNSEFVIVEVKKLVKRIPFKFWVYGIIILVIWQRKFISQILVSLIPGLGTKRLFKLFLGHKLE